MRLEYASRLTKDMLIKSGITEITEDGRVFKGTREIKYKTMGKTLYKYLIIYDFDENGNKIKMPSNTASYRYKQTTVSLHRAIYAWFYNEVPEGLVVDHIDDNKINNKLNNLQLLTPSQNLLKARKKLGSMGTYTPYMKKGGYTKEEILERIKYFKAKYNEAKNLHDAELAHRHRANLSQWRRRFEILFGNEEDED